MVLFSLYQVALIGLAKQSNHHSEGSIESITFSLFRSIFFLVAVRNVTCDTSFAAQRVLKLITCVGHRECDIQYN